MKKKKSKAGRKTSMTPDCVKKLEDAFSLGCTDTEACLYANISRQTFYAFSKKNPKFSDRMNDLKEKPVLKARTIVMRDLNNNDSATAKWYLERKKRDEFGHRTALENGLGADGKPQPLVIRVENAPPPPGLTPDDDYEISF